MKLTIFSAKTLPKSSGGNRGATPKISMTKGGLISLNKSAQDLTGITINDKISLAQDDDAQWFIFKDKEGFELRLNTDKRSVVFNHRGLKDMFCESVAKDSNVSNRFWVAGQPTVFDKVKYWGILVG